MIYGGPHPTERSWRDIEKYVNEHKGALEEERCLILSNTFPMKMPKTSAEDVVFKDRDSDGLLTPTVDPMVITVGLGPAIVRRVLVDMGASVNVLFVNTFQKIGSP